MKKIKVTKVKSLSPKVISLNEIDTFCFKFTYFCNFSVNFTKYNFNTFFLNCDDAIKSSMNLMISLINMSKLTLNDFNNIRYKNKYHFNFFDRDDSIDRIECILENCYGFSPNLIAEFDRNYLEFTFFNGQHVIGILVGKSIIEILFLDVNHLVCDGSSRNIKSKMKYNYPSVFSDWGKYKNDNINKLDFILECIRDGDITDVKDILEICEVNC